MSNWDYQSEDDALAAFSARATERLEHGYELREGALPETDTTC